MKSTFAFFLFLVFTYPSVAQHVLLGPKVGVQASRAFYDDKDYYDDFKSQPALTYHGGLVSNIKVSDLFSLETELLYSQTAKKLKGTDGYSFNIERYRNITVPLLLRGSFLAGYNQFYFNVGPNLSYWLGGKGKIRIPELVESGSEEMEYQIRFGDKIDQEGAFYVSDPNRLQLGLNIGAGVIFPINHNFLMLDLRYTWAHTNLAKQDTFYTNFLFFNDDLAYANHVLSFSVAYLFEFDFFTLSTKGKSKSKPKH